MRYLPHTPDDISSMLATIGVDSIDDLFSSIPSGVRMQDPLQLPEPMGEPDLVRHLQDLAARNHAPDTTHRFLGGGSYAHFTPALVGQLLLRGEFLTPYSPYQPEISQGTLQVIFEYQSMMSELFGMEVSNASLYDGSTALVEAIFMAERITRRRDYAIVTSVHPEYRAVAQTIVGSDETHHTIAVPVNTNGSVDVTALQAAITPQTASVVVQYPSFFGTVEDLRPIADMTHAAGALLIVVVPDPIAMGLFETPGAMGADIVVAEGQGLGNATNYGGPYVGIFTTRKKFLRQIPGRLSGLTADSNGKRGFVLTLSTREQFIRRERATSNICTNQQLCAVATTIYTAWLGREGLTQLAQLNWEKAEYAKAQLTAIDGVECLFTSPTFHEFVIQLPRPAADVLAALRDHDITGGLDLGRWYSEMPNAVVVCATEENSKTAIDQYAAALRVVLGAN